MAVLRISGALASEVAKRLTGQALPAPRRAALLTLRDPADGEAIDQALLLWLPGPGTATGEDMLEIQHHGGHAVLKRLLVCLGEMPGLRPAGAGEFTRRAFLNGKLDLTAAEGLADLIDATTKAQARQALRQLDGALGRLYQGWRERLLTALALIEAEIDFAAEEEVPDSMLARVLPDLRSLRAEMAAHLCDDGRGERLRAGLVVAVVGTSNVGKSSLVNLLARRDVAIVTSIPGTTRDVIEVQLDLEGVPVTLLDTAGLRWTVDPVEAAGIERARARAAQADLRLLVLDAAAPEAVDVAEALVVVNKIDLVPPGAALPLGSFGISCRTGQGVPELLRGLARRLETLVEAGETPLLTRARHRAAVMEAHAALERFEGQAESGGELALLGEDLRLAARAVGGITGVVGVEEVLDRVFASFCIGK